MNRRILHIDLLVGCIFAFLVVAITGVWLRAYPLFPDQPFIFRNLLHGHSHFAFGGWITPALAWLMLVTLPEFQDPVISRHIKRASFLLVASSYGMLFSFPYTGYDTISIVFSCISVFGTYYLAIFIFKAFRGNHALYAVLLKMAAGFLVFSSLGAFATGPLAALGMKESPIYFDSIHSYLHFYLNGWFCLVVLSFIAKTHFRQINSRTTRIVSLLFLFGTILTLSLSYLWHKPGLAFNIAGAAGSFLQIIAFSILISKVNLPKQQPSFDSLLFISILLAMGLKFILQGLTSIQSVSDYVVLHRVLTVAYLHLITLGIASAFVLQRIYNAIEKSRPAFRAILFFVIAFISTESLLVFQGFGSPVIPLPYYSTLLFISSLLFLSSAAMLLFAVLVHYFSIPSHSLGSANGA